MKIYRVVVDVQKFQWLIPEPESIWSTDRLVFDCQPKGGDWTPPAVYVHNPKRIAGDFFKFAPGALVCSERATDVLRGQLEMAGELLPLSAGSQRLTLLNVLECVNCLDEGRSEHIVDGLSPHYEFIPTRLGGSTVFKVPLTSRSEILTVAERAGSDPSEEFKFCVESNNLRGLRFEVLWSDT